MERDLTRCTSPSVYRVGRFSKLDMVVVIVLWGPPRCEHFVLFFQVFGRVVVRDV